MELECSIGRRFSAPRRRRAAPVVSDCWLAIKYAHGSTCKLTVVAGACMGAAGCLEQDGPWHGWPGIGAECESGMAGIEA